MRGLMVLSCRSLVIRAKIERNLWGFLMVGSKPSLQPSNLGICKLVLMFLVVKKCARVLSSCTFFVAPATATASSWQFPKFMPKMASELISGFEFELSSYFVFAAELQKKPERKFDHLLLKFNISGPFFKFKVFLSSFFLT